MSNEELVTSTVLVRWEIPADKYGVEQTFVMTEVTQGDRKGLYLAAENGDGTGYPVAQFLDGYDPVAAVGFLSYLGDGVVTQFHESLRHDG